MRKILNVALPKGRLGEKVYDLFEKAGYGCPTIKEPGRRLVFENLEKGIRFFWVKPSDVGVYVERGAADVGIVGKDVLTEYGSDVYELLDLGIGKCSMAVAAKADFQDDRSKPLVVATKFERIAKRYYAERDREIDIVRLNGSIELAPLLGLSDVIVDIVETGATLRENGLVIVERFADVSARLIANKSSFKFKTNGVEDLVDGLQKQIGMNKSDD